MQLGMKALTDLARSNIRTQVTAAGSRRDTKAFTIRDFILPVLPETFCPMTSNVFCFHSGGTIT